MADEYPIVKLHDLRDIYENKSSAYRFCLSSLWTTRKPFLSDVADGSGTKKSVYVESPGKTGAATLLISFSESPCTKFFDENFIKINQLIHVIGAKVSHNPRSETRCPYQILLDAQSLIKIVEVDKLPSLQLNLISVKTIKESFDKTVVDLVADLKVVPIEKIRDANPVKLRLKDTMSDEEIIWNLWDEDEDDDERLHELMGKQLLIRNGHIEYYSLFEEWQVTKPIDSVLLYNVF